MAMNMSYCMHDNTAKALEEVWDEWYAYDLNKGSSYENRGRARLLELILEMVGEMDEDDMLAEIAELKEAARNA